MFGTTQWMDQSINLLNEHGKDKVALVLGDNIFFGGGMGKQLTSSVLKSKWILVVKK
ncbi:MAG: hypothetical protein ACJ0QO_01425 [Parvicellaceae bacterium]